MGLKRRELAAVERRLHAPTPRIALGQALRKLANSAIDISDGLVADLGHICERSRVAAVIRFESLPASAVMKRYLGLPTARAALLAGGDDYELCFTAEPARHQTILGIAHRIGLKLTCIGTVRRRPTRAAPAVTVVARDGRPMDV